MANTLRFILFKMQFVS